MGLRNDIIQAVQLGTLNRSGFTAVEVEDLFGNQYKKSFIKSILPNSEIDSSHSGHYVKFTKRVSDGVYIIRT